MQKRQHQLDNMKYADTKYMADYIKETRTDFTEEDIDGPKLEQTHLKPN